MNRAVLAAALLLFPAAPAVAALLGTLLAGSPPASLGARDGRLAPCPATPNCVSSQADDGAHRIGSLVFSGDPAVALRRLAEIVAAQPGATIVTHRGDYLHAEFASALMGFVDDFEAHVGPGARVVELRSASRLGYGDFGVNRKRVEAIRTAFEALPK